MKVAIIVPVRNGGTVWRKTAAAIHAQSRQPDRVLVIDSASTDGSDGVAEEFGFELIRIAVRDFDHGATRQKAAESCKDCDVLVYLTQDAVLADPGSLNALLRAFDDQEVAMAYGRQLPRPGANPIEAHARLFNYPAKSARRTMADAASLGLKAAFASNSFCAYRWVELMHVGGFPSRTILAEDMIVAARVLKRGRAVAYVGDAHVYHSHKYSFSEELRRYFDIGALHAQQAWLLKDFGQPEGEGMRFVLSEAHYLMGHSPLSIPSAVVRTVIKLLGYRLGRNFFRLDPAFRKRLSMNKGFWES